MARLLPIVPVAIALAGTASAGCGADARGEANRYVNGVSRIESAFEGVVLDLGQRAPASPRPPVLAATLQRTAQAVEGQAERLERLGPPRDVAALHARLVGSFRAYARDLGRLGAEIPDAPDWRPRTLTRVNGLTAAAVRSFNQVARAVNARFHPAQGSRS